MRIRDSIAVPSLALAAGIVLCAVGMLWIAPESPDMLHRYALMAEAFAIGDFTMSFYPRFGVLFPVLTGLVVRLTGLDGPHACQFCAVMLWCAAAIPLWSIANRLFGRVAAYCAVILFLTNGDMLACAMDGWRDGCRALPTLWIVLGFLRLRERDGVPTGSRGDIWFALGLLMLSTLRVDAYVVAAIALVVYSLWAVLSRRAHLIVLPVLSFAAGTVAQCCMIFAYTGWFVPVPHVIRLLEAWK